MTEVLGDFIRALRASDVRISTAESIDAGNAINLIGFEDRETLRNSLSQVLAKTPEEKQAFADCFDQFFSFGQFKDGGEAANANEEEGEAGEPEGTPASGPRPAGGSGAPGEGEGQAAGEGDLLTMLQSGDAVRLQMALAEAAREVGLNRIRLFTQRGLFTRRIMEAMGLAQLNEEIDRATMKGDAEEDAYADQVRQLRDELRGQVRDYVEKQLQIFTANAGKQLREEVLSKIRLTNVDQRDFKLMRELVRKMAKRLVSLHARRKKKARRGMLDVRHTIRRNVEYQGLLFDIVWKRTKIDRPKVIAVCDVSGSVAQVARFLLMFLYSVQEVIPKVRSFAFSGRLGEVTDLFSEQDIETAIAETLKEYSGGSTDYGQAFLDLEALAIDDIDHRTTVLILGDARSNFGDPRGDILQKIHERARRVIWLNPEGRTLWGTGDSEMPRLAPYCDKTQTCASLRDLERVVSELLRTAV